MYMHVKINLLSIYFQVTDLITHEPLVPNVRLVKYWFHFDVGLIIALVFDQKICYLNYNK